jgi:hypothetical protein
MDVVGLRVIGKGKERGHTKIRTSLCIAICEYRGVRDKA